MEQEKIDKILQEKWFWRGVSRYDYAKVDQYNTAAGAGSGTTNSLSPTQAFRSQRKAEDVANSMNGAYGAGIGRGRAEIIKWLQDHGEEHTADLIMNSGQFDD